MKISLVLATIGRQSELRRFLESLSVQERHSGRSDLSIELVVVDQSSETDRSAIESLVLSYSSYFQVVYLHTSEKGLSRARNLGLTRVTGDILGFPDDDCWYSKDFLVRVVKVFSENVDAAYVCGQYTEPGVVNAHFKQERRILRDFSDARYGSSVTLFVDMSRLEGFQIDFDESLGAGAPLPAGEETDLMARILLTGRRGLYEPSVCAFHKIVRGDISVESILRRESAYGYWLGKHFGGRGVILFSAQGFFKLFVLSLFDRFARQRLMTRWKAFHGAKKCEHLFNV